MVPFWMAAARPPGDVRLPMLAGTVPLKSATTKFLRQVLSTDRQATCLHCASLSQQTGCAHAA
jgi:hypothetical protein